jgi:putative protein kinase ArgK-like GTPase of G3E family
MPAGVIAGLRRQQAQAWFGDLIDEELRRRFYSDPQVTIRLNETRQALLDGQITAVQAAQALFRAAECSATRFNPEPAKN